AVDPRHRVRDTEMAGMLRIPQSIDNPQIETLKRLPAFMRNVMHVRCVGSVADPVTQRRNIAVLHEKGRQCERAALALDSLVLAGLDGEAVQNRGIAAAL